MKAATGRVKIAGVPSPIYFIGDSHCILFNNLLFRDRVSGREYLSIAKYIPNLNGDRIMEGDNLNSHLLWALAAESLIVQRDDGWIARHVVEGGDDPPLVFFCGEIDVRGMAKKIGDEADFVLPFPLPDAERFKGAAAPRIVPFSIIEDAVNQKVWNTLSALHRLVKAGFRKVYLHSITPDSMRHPSLVQYRLTTFFQVLFAANAASIGVRMLNVWDSVTRHNQLRPELYLDGIHLNKHASIITMSALFSDLGFPGGAELVARLAPVYLLGERRVEDLNRIVYRREDSSDLFVVRSHHIPELRFATALEGPAAANQPLMRTLFSDMLLLFDFETREFFAAHRPTSPAGESLVKATMRSRRDPLLVFFLGEEELERIAAYDDPLVEAALRVSVFLAALKGLRDSGFHNVCVSAVGLHESADPLHEEIARRINSELSARCASAGAHYLGEFEPDALAIIEAIDQAHRRREREALPEVHAMAATVAQAIWAFRGEAVDGAICERWEACGEVALISDPGLARNLASALDFRRRRDLMRRDWVSDELSDALENTEWAAPGDEELRALASVLFSDTVRRAVTSVMRSEYVVAGVRPFRVPNGAWPDWTSSPVPTGVFHASLSLGGAHAGEIVLRDRARLERWMRSLEPGSDHVDLLILPEDAYFGRFIGHAGSSAWPVDPVNLSLEGVTLVRPL